MLGLSGFNQAPPLHDERDPKESPFYKAGAEARRAGTKLQNSALRKLRPGCKEYDWYIAGYDSVPYAKLKRS